MSSSPGSRKGPPRPKIQLPLPGQYYPQTGMGYVATPYGQTPIPMTPVSGHPRTMYANRASEFVFSQFKGIKDLTKSGLSVGEKCAFWLYEKVSSWSKRWFTHIFLFVIVLLYSIGGAMIFVTIEGTNEDVIHSNIRKERNKTLTTIRELCDDQEYTSNSDLWNGRARNELMEYEEHLYEFYKRGFTDRGKKVWTFWNAVFYCGTIYTTIAEPLNGLQWLQGQHRDAFSVVGLRVARDSRSGFARYPLRQKHLVPLVAAAPIASWVVGAASVLFLSRCPSAPARSNRRTQSSARASFSNQSITVRRRQFHLVPCSVQGSSLSSNMEDSYTVHRRRKAAARRREKTPDPASRNQQLVETSDDEEGTRRARMERMAEDAERTEQEEREKKKKLEEQKVEEERKGTISVEESGKKKSSPLKEARENDAETRSVKKETKVETGSPAKEETKSSEVIAKEKYQDTLPKSKEIDADIDQPAEGPRKVERRLKKKSRERVERHGQSTDSSDAEELDKHSRRTKSPEGAKLRVKKASSKKTFAEEGDTKKDAIEKPPREKKSIKPKVEEAEVTVKPERRRSRRYSQTEDTDEDPKMKKSETFPRQTTEEVVMKRSLSDVKKQIIPLSNDSLIQDFAKAQREYLKREQSILDPETPDVFDDAQEETVLRRRKFSMPLTETEQEAVQKSIEKLKGPEKKRSWFSWLPFFRKRKEDKEAEVQKDQEEPKEIIEPSEPTKTKFIEVAKLEKVTFMDFLRALKDVVAEFKAFVAQNPREAQIVRILRNRCMSQLMLIMIYCGLGAFIFRFTEGAFETFYKCGVKRVKRDFLDSLWNYSHNLKEEDWKSMARRKLMEFEEQLHNAHEAGVHTYSGQRSWSFLNAVVYCLTVITTIGYGHISPSTNTGRAITIVYAIFGIPMFLIILADFGKLFTRGIKFLWAFVRRLYYTGSCRKVRRTAPVQEVMKGVQLVYDLATFKGTSQINPENIEEMQKQAQQSQPPVLNLDGNVPESPGTPAMSAFAVDDEFNLPISVAISILLGYIFIGATLFCLSEDWGFFESFYFVFISMSTIGFGDYVPKHPIYMMCSIIYLVFGLSLTSMCINVVQVMLSDSFKQASEKIGATIGFEIDEEDNSVHPAVPPPVEVADVHVIVKESESPTKIAPKAKQEDVDL